MRSGNIKSVITQISMDHNVKMARALRKLAANVSADLAASSVKPVVSSMGEDRSGFNVRVIHGVKAVSDSNSARKISEAHRSLAQKLSSKSEVTKMMGM